MNCTIKKKEQNEQSNGQLVASIRYEFTDFDCTSNQQPEKKKKIKWKQQQQQQKTKYLST